MDEKQPPFLILYAEKDLPALDIQAIGLERELKKHYSPVSRVRVPDRGHFTIVRRIGAENDPTTELMLAFIRRCSRTPDY